MYCAAALKVAAAGRATAVKMHDVRTPMIAVNRFVVKVLADRLERVWGLCEEGTME